MSDYLGAVLFCPVCCSNIDTTAEGELSLVCPTCETEFTVKVDPDKIALHAMHG